MKKASPTDVLLWAQQCKLYTTNPKEVRMDALILRRLRKFAEMAMAQERDECSRVKAGTAPRLKPTNNPVLSREQQFCFELGWKQGAAAVRTNIKKRGTEDGEHPGE